MPVIPETPRPPRRLSETSLDLTQQDYHWMVDRRLAALEAQPPPERGEHYDTPLERIVQTANFLPVNFLSIGAGSARAVCRIEMSDSLGRWRAWGTGFLVTPDVVMTNNHVFEAPEWAEAARLLFGDELDEENEPKQPEIFRLDPGRLFVTNQELDFTLCAVKGRPGGKYGYLPLNRDPHIISRHEHVNIVQHPRGRKKEVCLQDNRVQYVKTRVLLYTTDTEPGSSGSPVFDNGWRVVALHHSGGEQEDGKWLNNEGVRIASIVRYLEELLVEDADERLREVLGYATGVNPYEGLFGVYGRRPRVPEEWPGAEKVVYNYQGADSFLDVGFWNIERFNNSAPEWRRRKVADLLEQLSLDVIGLVEIQEGPVRWVVDELNRRGFRMDVLMEDAPGSQDIALVYDTRTTKADKIAWSAGAAERLRAKVDGTNKSAWYRLPLLARVTTTQTRGLDGEPFDFLICVVHAKATTSFDEPGVPQQVRAEAAKRLAAELKAVMEELGEDDLIVGGDFNAKLEEPSFNPLADTLSAVALTSGDAQSGDPDAYTYLGSKKGFIDHIYITPGAKVNYDPGSISITRIDREIPKFRDQISDHAPVIARFTFQEQAGEDQPPAPPAEQAYEVKVPAGTKKVIIRLE